MNLDQLIDRLTDLRRTYTELDVGGLPVHLTVDFEGFGQWTGPLTDVGVSKVSLVSRRNRIELISENEESAQDDISLTSPEVFNDG